MKSIIFLITTVLSLSTFAAENSGPKFVRADGSSREMNSEEANGPKFIKIKPSVKAEPTQPIYYGMGAGGVSLYSTKDMIIDRLDNPAYSDKNVMYFTNKSLYFVFEDEPQADSTPLMIIPVNGYVGGMDAGKLGVLNYQTKFLKYAADGFSGAEKLTQELYNVFEKNNDPNYNCIQEASCRVIYGDYNQKNFVIVLPGAVFLLAKEEFQLAEIRLIHRKIILE